MNSAYTPLGSLDIQSINNSFRAIPPTNLPERALSRQDGTKTSCERRFPNGGFWTDCRLVAFSYRQIPFRFFHSERCNCGLGYSGHGLVPTSSVQGVVRGGCFGEYWLPTFTLAAQPMPASSNVSRELAICMLHAPWVGNESRSNAEG